MAAIKRVSFNNNEKEKKLVTEIEKYQKKHQINSFSETVRYLCEIGLKFKEIAK